MKLNPVLHHRRSIRLKDYDYSQQGGYFVTICARNRELLFGRIAEEKMLLNDAGKFANKCWLEIPEHFLHVTLDEFIVMPNHIHGIIIIDTMGNVGVQNFEPLHKQNKYQQIIPKSIGSIIRGFKIGVTKWFRKNTNIYNVWQRNYYEHIFRNEDGLNRIRECIINNPIQWQFDRENPHNIIDKTYHANWSKIEELIYGKINK
ncbi:MAG: transposase [Candidatus Scalinduaceae bacterium]